MQLPFWKRMLFGLAGMKYDRMAARNGQHYHFIFVHEDGEGLRQVSRIFEQNHIPASVALRDRLGDVRHLPCQ